MADNKTDKVSSTDINIADSTITSEVARQVKAVTDPLSKQLKLLYNLMKDLSQSSILNKESNGVAQGLSKAPNNKSDILSRTHV